MFWGRVWGGAGQPRRGSVWGPCVWAGGLGSLGGCLGAVCGGGGGRGWAA